MARVHRAEMKRRSSHELSGLDRNALRMKCDDHVRRAAVNLLRKAGFALSTKTQSS